VHLVGFIIRTYHDVQSPERQIQKEVEYQNIYRESETHEKKYYSLQCNKYASYWTDDYCILIQSVLCRPFPLIYLLKFNVKGYLTRTA